MKKRINSPKITHYIIFLIRILLLLVYGGAWVLQPNQEFFFLPIWLIFMIEMLIRLSGSGLNGAGSKKQYLKYFSPESGSGHFDQSKKTRKGAWCVALIGISLTVLIGIFFYMGWFDRSFITLIFLVYGFCDSICVLYFCPFQYLFMKNRCCTVCRIYNWDYILLLAPLIFLNTFYSWSLIAVASLILLQWELLYHRHPERFLEQTNQALSCRNCTEQNCSCKKNVYHFLDSFFRK